MNAASRHYQTLSIASRIEAAGRHELVSILYEELLRALDVMRTALVQHKADAVQLGRSRASSILVALDASLDFERGGDLARTLAQIYRAMQKELAAAVHAKEPARLAEIRGGVAELLAAWKRIATKQGAGATG